MTQKSSLLIKYNVTVHGYTTSNSAVLLRELASITAASLGKSCIRAVGISAVSDNSRRHVRAYTVNRSAMAFKKQGKESFTEESLRLTITITVDVAATLAPESMAALSKELACISLVGSTVSSVGVSVALPGLMPVN